MNVWYKALLSFQHAEYSKLKSSRYLYQDGKRYVTVEHAAEQMLYARNDGIREAMKIVEANYRPDDWCTLLKIEALLNSM